MSIRKKIVDGLEALLTRVVGKDKLKSTKMIMTAYQVQQQGAEGHVWADYMFLAACYGAAGGDEKVVQSAVTKIREGYPNYDPSTRFRWDNVIPSDMNAEEIFDGTYRANAMRWRAPAIGYMNKFCDDHRDFSFAESLGGYFAGAKSMVIKQDKE
ncbi:MAG TPA: hypothetical protein VJB35_00820 [Candidatus Nanoarchaeia archaeon]|nr:hypothetical protein [Candidatus Nanoarchaeia archaeon]